MVPEVGLEPTRSNEQRILSPLCLPFHHPGLKWLPGNDSNVQNIFINSEVHYHFATEELYYFLCKLRERNHTFFSSLSDKAL